MDILQEFERQIQNLKDKDYPKEVFGKIKKLRKYLVTIPMLEIDLEKGKLPFVIVVSEKFIDLEEAMIKVEKNNKLGVAKLKPLHARDFDTIESVTIESDVYLLVDIDRGKETLNVTPENALKEIRQKDRSPLTIAEGIAIVTQFPEFLMKNNCFSLLASRKPDTQHVPAIWINANKQANLGWCWDRNPHSWLGSASANKRLR